MRHGIISRLVLALVAVACVATASALYFSHRAILKQDDELMHELATVTAGLISSISAFDRAYSANDHPQGSTGATLSQVRNAMELTDGFGGSGEILLVADGGNDSLYVLVHQNRQGRGERDHPNVITKTSSYAAPFLAGLAGKSGTMRAKAHSGHEVLVAYAPVKGMNWVVAAEIHVTELQQPFLQAAIPTLLVAALVAVFGATFTYRQTAVVIGALKAEEQKFQDFADSASDWLWMQDENFRFVSLGVKNRPDEAIAEERIIGRVREEFTVEDTTTEKWRNFRAELEAHRPFRNFVYEMRTMSGPPITVSINGVPVFDGKGNFRGYRGTGSNVDPILKRDKMLAEAEERLRTAFNSMTVGVIQIDEGGLVRYFNPKAEEMFGYRANEVMARNVSMLMPEPDRSRHDGYIGAFLSTGHKKVIGIGREVWGRRKDGSIFPLHLGVSELALDGNRHFIGALTDLSTVKTLEAQLRRASKLEAIGQLSGGVAHDFNNLLGIILGNLELMQRKMEPGSKVHDQVGKAITAAKRGVNLTRQLLNFSQQSPETLVPVPVDINQTIIDLNDLLTRSLTAHINLKTVLDPNLPFARTNKSEFEDALLNLIVNARDAMKDGGSIVLETGHVDVSKVDNLVLLDLEPGSYVQISVTDSGSGMSKATIEKIFEPFFTTKGQGKGTGLGLAMVYGLVKRSGGHIAVYSEEGYGTTFRIYLPAVNDTETTDHRAAQQSTSAPEIRGGVETVLVVDDEAALTEIASNILQDAGYTALKTDSVHEALEILNSDARIDLLFSDLVMPDGLNGIALAMAAEVLRPDIKVLLTSGFSGQLFDKRSLAKWGSDLLPKPYSSAALKTSVRAKLDERKYRAAAPDRR
jgi:PAS domain S-box-containing protein